MSNVVVEVTQTQATLEADTPNIVEINGQTTVVSVEQPAPQIIDVVAVGPQGVPGPAGPPGNDAAFLLGVPLSFVNGQPNDLLSFTGSEWRNRPQEEVSDGGNF